MKKYLIFFTLFILISCGHKLDSEVEKEVSYISKYETCILADFVFQTPSYLNLMTVASNDDLIYLTNDENPVVRYFAFIGLMERNYPKINQIYESHKNDTEVISTSNGACLKNSVSVNSLMKDAISKESIYTLYFSKNKYYRKKRTLKSATNSHS